MDSAAWMILSTAVALDLAFGDPKWLPHPVILMGKGIGFFEKPFRMIFKAPFVAGLFFSLFLISLTFGTALGILAAAAAIHPGAGILVQILLLFFCFSVKSLRDAALNVAKPLKEGNLALARKQVAMIVGRETRTLDETAVTRAAVETVAENFVDGFLSPLFWFLLLGVPGALAYKMGNTLDSMVGYKNRTYMLFGRTAARIDDAANFIPARLSVYIIFSATALLSFKKAGRVLKTARTDSRLHKSPNAGFPEAAFSGALGVRMGGPNVYHGIKVEKPFIGRAFGDPLPRAIDRACELMVLSALMALAGALLLAVAATGS